MEPVHNSGQSITGAYEGWFSNPDGTFSILFGYYNRNLKQDLDIPVGPNNRIEPGGPDQGQPTHFLPGTAMGRVHGDCAEGFRTRRSPGRSPPTVRPRRFRPASIRYGNLRHSRTRREIPRHGSDFRRAALSHKARASSSRRCRHRQATPMPMTAWAADDAVRPPGAPQNRLPPVIVSWSKYRGPGAVSFLPARAGAAKADFTAPPGALSPAKRARPRPSANPANTFCAWSETTGRAKAAEVSNAAGPTRRSR